MMARSCLTVLAVATASFSAQVQSETHSESKNDIISISEWNYDKLYEMQGIQSENLMDTEVFGPEGEEIGSVENVIISDKNQIVAIIAQVGGFWDIGDTHIAVPWDEVTMTDDGVQIPATEDNIDDYSLFGTNSFVTKQDLEQTTQVGDEVSTGTQTWKLTDLVDDYASLSGGISYGYVESVIFSQSGEIEAVVVESEGSRYAYPFYGYGYGWSPGYSAYELPYEENEVSNMEPFNYEEFEAGSS